MIIYGSELTGDTGRIPGSNIVCTRKGIVMDLMGKVLYDPTKMNKEAVELARSEVNFIINGESVSWDLRNVIFFSFLGDVIECIPDDKRAKGVAKYKYKGESFCIVPIDDNGDSTDLDNYMLISPAKYPNIDHKEPTITIDANFLLGIIKYNYMMMDKISEAKKVIRPFDLYHSHFKMFKSAIAKIVGWDCFLLDDITSDVFIRAENKFDKYDPALSNITTWMYVVAKNVALQYMKNKHKAGIHMDLNDDKFTMLKTDDSADYSKDRADYDFEHLKTLLPELYEVISKQDIKIVEMRLSGSSYVEISEEVCLKLNTIKTRLRRIMLKAEKMIHDEPTNKGNIKGKPRRKKYKDPQYLLIDADILTLRAENISYNAIINIINEKHGVMINRTRINNLINNTKKIAKDKLIKESKLKIRLMDEDQTDYI